MFLRKRERFFQTMFGHTKISCFIYSLKDLLSINIIWRAKNENLSFHYFNSFQIREKLQLVGASAMLIAGKMEEIYPPLPKEWSYLTSDSYTTRQVIKMEQLIIKVLDFKLVSPTSYTFVRKFCEDHKIDTITTNLAMVRANDFLSLWKITPMLLTVDNDSIIAVLWNFNMWIYEVNTSNQKSPLRELCTPSLTFRHEIQYFERFHIGQLLDSTGLPTKAFFSLSLQS